MKKIICTTLLFAASIASVKAQENTKKVRLYSNKFTVLAGLIQPTVLKGGNFEINYTTKRMIFEYSHGFNLNPASSGAYKDQKVSLHLPFSTGFGIGYRINSFLDIRFEPKLHSWEIYSKDEEQIAENKIKEFKTFTLGLGLYYRYFPFRNSQNKFLQGITTSSSIRWWQNVGSTLSHDKFSYTNTNSETGKTLKAPNIGVGNTPIIVNVAVGYTFGGK